MKNNTEIKMVIVDDHDLVREGITARLSDVGYINIIGQGASGLDAVELCKTLKPDVLLMDISMPKMNGMEAAIEIKKQCWQTKILFLSIYDDDEYVREALRIGASGFVLKDVSKPEMLVAIKAAAAGQKYLGKKVSNALLNAKNSDQDTDVDYGLTKREKQVLGLIAEGHQNKEIAYRLNISIRTVESHRSTVRDKTGGGNAATLAKIARTLGL